MSTERARRALLFGALAYRLGLVDRRRLALGLTAWAGAKAADGSSAFVQSGALDARDALKVEASSAQLLALHDGEVVRALGTVHVEAEIRDALSAIPDVELRGALGGLDTSPQEEVDLGATLGLDCPDDGPERTVTGEFEKTERFDPPSGGISQASASVAARPVPPEPSGEHTFQDLSGHTASVSSAGHSTVSALLSSGSHDRTERFDDPEATMAEGPGYTQQFVPASGSGLGDIPQVSAEVSKPALHADPNATIEVTQSGGLDPHATAAFTDGAPTHDHTANYDPSRPDGSPRPAPVGGAPSVSVRGVGPGHSSVMAESQHGSRGGGPTAAAGGVATARSRYRVSRPHAKGGLGEVFVAVDSELNREVALKEILGRHADDLVSRTRFVVEAEVTGGLEHPGIVPVYGLGTYVDGRPYYAMRFVRGETLRDAINRYHGISEGKPDEKTNGEPKPEPPVGSRELELHKLLRRFIDVCNALEYAHSRGVLHRDIKPANIMLGPFGETLVVDWGLAKPLPESGLGHGAGKKADAKFEPVTPGTGPLRPTSASGSMYQVLYGSTVGTPHYMSPEQSYGEDDGPACDIYSMGATLYHLLVGRSPFTEKKLQPLLEKVRAGDFAPPRQVKPEVHPALEAICLKAMALKPEDRYASCRELAEDVEHWMADEPVSAYPEPWTARAARWARRHRTLVTTAGSLLVMAVFGLSTATVLINREKERTEENFLLARSAVDTLLTQLGDVDLADIPGAEGVRKEMLEKARTYYDRFLAQQGGRLVVRQGTGQAYTRAGKIQELLGQYRPAEERYRRAIGLLNQLTTARGNEADVYRRDLAEARHNLGVLLTRLGRYEEARTELTAAVDTRTRLAARRDATDADRAAEQESVYRLGALLARRPGNREQAQAYYTRAIAQTEARLKAAEKNAATDDDAVRSLARYRNQHAMLLRWSDAPKAESLFKQAIGELETLQKKRPNVVANRWLLARGWNNLGALYDQRDRVVEANTYYRGADAFLDGLTKDYPRVPDYQFELAVSRGTLAWMWWWKVDVVGDEIAPARRSLQFIEGASKLARDSFDRLSKTYPGRPDIRVWSLIMQDRLALVTHVLGVLNQREAIASGDMARREAPQKSLAEADGNAESMLRSTKDKLAALVDPENYPEYAESIDYRVTTAWNRVGLAGLLIGRLERGVAPTSEIEVLVDEALRLCQAIRKDDPVNREAAQALQNAYELQAELRLRRGLYEDAFLALLAGARELAADFEPSPTRLERVCRTLALYLAKATDSKVKDRLGPEVVKLLRKAILDLGAPASSLNDKAYDILKALPEFQELRKAATSRPAVG